MMRKLNQQPRQPHSGTAGALRRRSLGAKRLDHAREDAVLRSMLAEDVKLDLAPEAELALLKETIGSLNPHAKLLDSTRGVVEPTSILGAAKGQGVSKLDSDGEMRRIVTHLHEPMRYPIGCPPHHSGTDGSD